jgi:glycosyltransferase involved in cell wall biosynthesis
VAHSLSKALLSQGHQVRVCTTNLKNPSADLDVELDKPVDVDGVRVYYSPVLGFRYWGFAPVLARRVWIESRWAHVVLLHFHYQFASLVGGWISRCRKKPYVIFTHGSLNRYSVDERSSFYKKCYVRVAEHGNFRNAAFTAYHSYEEMVSSFRFGNSLVVPNGIDPGEFENVPEMGYFRKKYPEIRNRIVYLYLGRLGSGKGLDLLVPAFQRVKMRRSDVHLVIAGGSERGYEAVVAKMIDELQIGGNVTLTGLVDGSLKLGVLKDADVFVLPSRGEGLSIAMLEAMYMGLPVVVSNRVGLWRQIVKKKAGLVVRLTVEDLAEAMIHVAENHERREIGKRGRKLIQSDYSWNVIAGNLIAQIEERTS